MGLYDTGLVCASGHIVNWAATRYPERNAKFCKECGKPTTSACSGCGAKIRGRYTVPGVVALGNTPSQPPAYCHECGTAYPWTEARIQAASDLIDLADDVSESDKAALVKAVPDLLRETPQSQVSATRWKKFLNGPGKQIAEGAKSVFVEVVAESVKRTIWGP